MHGRLIIKLPISENPIRVGSISLAALAGGGEGKRRGITRKRRSAAIETSGLNRNLVAPR